MFVLILILYFDSFGDDQGERKRKRSNCVGCEVRNSREELEEEKEYDENIKM